MVRGIITSLLLLIVLPLWAADIKVSTSQNPVAVNETFRISFTVNGSHDGEPDFSPLNKDFQLLGTGQSSSVQIINGNINSSKTYNLTVTALRQGNLTIPSISFGKDKSPPYPMTVTAATPMPRQAPSSQMPPRSPQNMPQARGNQQAPSQTNTVNEDDIVVVTEVDTQSPYVQQQVILSVKVYRRVAWADASLSDPTFVGVEALVQSLGQQQDRNVTFNGKPYILSELRYAIFPQQSGDLTIKPFTLVAKLPTGKSTRSSPGGAFNDPIFDNFFSRQTYTTRKKLSKAINLDIKPIPASFTGNHWLPARKIELQEDWSGDASSLKAGEPVTRTIGIIGDGISTGQLPEVNMVEQDGLKIYPDQPLKNEQTSANGLMSSHTQKFAIIPANGGNIQLPDIEIPWWNINTDKQEVARLSGQLLAVTGVIPAEKPKPAPQANAPKTAEPENKPGLSDWQVLLKEDTTLYLVIAILILIALWLITLIAWLNARRRPAVAKDHEKRQEEKKLRHNEIMKQLGKACNSKDANAIRDALLIWGKTIWPDSPPASLNDIATRGSKEFAAHVTALSRQLYSGQQTEWDAHTIYREAEKIKLNDGKNQTIESSLEPLYR